MLPKYILKYILDIESILNEIDELKASVQNNFEVFSADIKSVRALERQLEIIGEAVNRIYKQDPHIKISGIKGIIALRNFIAHAYDSVDHQILWGIVQKDLPILRSEIERLKQAP